MFSCFWIPTDYFIWMGRNTPKVSYGKLENVSQSDIFVSAYILFQCYCHIACLYNRLGCTGELCYAARITEAYLWPRNYLCRRPRCTGASPSIWNSRPASPLRGAKAAPVRNWRLLRCARNDWRDTAFPLGVFELLEGPLFRSRDCSAGTHPAGLVLSRF